MTRRSLIAAAPAILTAQTKSKTPAKAAAPWEFAITLGGEQKMPLKQFRGKVLAVEILKTT